MNELAIKLNHMLRDFEWVRRIILSEDGFVVLVHIDTPRHLISKVPSTWFGYDVVIVKEERDICFY